MCSPNPTTILFKLTPQLLTNSLQDCCLPWLLLLLPSPETEVQDCSTPKKGLLTWLTPKHCTPDISELQLPEILLPN